MEEKEMTELLIPVYEFTKTGEGTDAVSSEDSLWNFALHVGFGGGGISCGVTGLFMSAVGYVSGFFGAKADSSQMPDVGTISLFAAFPLLTFSAPALDKLSENKRARLRTARKTTK